MGLLNGLEKIEKMDLLGEITKIETLDDESLITIPYEDDLSKVFAQSCFIKLPSFFKKGLFELLKEEAFMLLSHHSNRKDFLMPATNFTKRQITTVSGKQVNTHGNYIPSLYTLPALTAFLSKIAGESIFYTPDQIDRHTVHRMHREADEHGGHVDSYAFAFVICLESPAINEGGEVQFIPNSLEIDKLSSDEAITERLNVGDCYFMRTDKAVHRVRSLKKETNRTVIVMTYADENTKDLVESYSSENLYD